MNVSILLFLEQSTQLKFQDKIKAFRKQTKLRVDRSEVSPAPFVCGKPNSGKYKLILVKKYRWQRRLQNIPVALNQVVSSCAACVVHDMAINCFERGALMARLWNIYTELLDAEWSNLKQESERWIQKSRDQEAEIQRYRR